MRQVKVALTSRITQEGQSETFHRQGAGQMQSQGESTRISYLEQGLVPVQILLKPGKMLIRRGSKQDYSLLRLDIEKKAACRYVVQGRQMDLSSVTRKLSFADNRKVHVEYDLFSGLYLVGNYTVTLIFT